MLARQHALQWTAEAIGVCALITPWNWPLNQIVCKVAAPTGIIFAEILPCGRIFSTVWIRQPSALRKFGPDVLVLSLGFDIYENDPQSKVSVSHEGFRFLGQRIKALGIPCVVVQEGGYDIATLDENASRFFAGMTA